MNQIIYQTKSYTISIGTNKDGDRVYQIINKKFDVVETETRLYPQAIKYANDLEAGLAAVIDMSE